MGQLATESLLWVKSELDIVFMHARQGLEVYVDNSSDKGALAECVRALHQAQGTLRIVEVWGGFLLAEEMEAVARGIYDGAVEGSDEAYEILMRAILQSPDYLEQVINAQHDMPLTLLPLVNDLRHIRGAAALSESELFSYTLDETGAQLPSIAPANDAEAVDLSSLAKKLRPKFQSALLSWFKKGRTRALKRMMAVVNQLEQAASQPAVFEMWWVMGGALEALSDGGIEATNDFKKVLGRIDRQIKRFINESEVEFGDNPPRELINNLLYYVGRSDSNGERVTSIKQSFNLGELLPESDAIDEAREALAGPNAQLIRTVSAAIREDVIQVKDSLDIFVRTGHQDVGQLSSLADTLKKVSGTLETLDLGTLGESLDEHVKTLTDMAAGQREIDDASLMAIAQSLVTLETRLSGDVALLMAAGAHTKNDDTNEADDQYQDSFDAVIRESIINLARVKEALTRYSRGDENAAIAQEAPSQLKQIQAALQVLNMERPGAILGHIADYVAEKVLAADKRPTIDSLERMADALVSVEFYLETIQRGRGDPQSMLANAETCLTHLDVGAAQSPALSVVETEDEGEDAVIETQVDFDPEDTVLPEDAAALEATEPEVDAQEDAPIQTSAQAEQPQPPVTETAASLSDKIPERDDVDPEILDIFLEEAQEELASLRDYVPRWQRHHDDWDALTVIRRSFHTLKGSGRMVGAKRIGEFAWAVENMLNRVLDKTIPAAEKVVDLVGDVVDVLPEMIDDLRNGEDSDVDIGALVASADAYSRGVDPVLESTPAAEEPTNTDEAISTAPVAEQTASAETQEPEEAGEEVGEKVDAKAEQTLGNELAAQHTPAMEPGLYDIFSKESATHLDVLNAFVSELEKGHAGTPSDDVLRTMHTLKGSANMAGAQAVSDLVEPGEKLLRELAAQELPVPSDATPVLRDTVTIIGMLVDALGDKSAQTPDISALQKQLEQLAATAAEHNSTAEPLAEPIPQLAESDDFDPELAAIFFEEARELIENIDTAMERWSGNPADDTIIAELQRLLHTFKGGARMAGLASLGDLSHDLETLLTPVAAGRLEVSDNLLGLVQQVVDRLHQMLESAINGAVPQSPEDLQKKIAWYQNPVGEEPKLEPAPASVPRRKAGTTPKTQGNATAEQHSDASDDATEAPTDAPAPEEVDNSNQNANRARKAGALQPDMMRVRADLLDTALDHAGEVGIYRSRLEQHTNNMNFNVAEFDSTVTRLREQLRQFEIETEAQIVFQHEQDGGEERGDFDPLELDRYSQLQQLSRSLLESVGDLVSLQNLLENQSREAETLLLQQSRVTTELQDSLMRTRMVPFSRHSQRLRRVVRQTARETGKQAELKLHGAEGEMDRQVLERILAPLEHMLRNSVVHGIEEPAQRQTAGKDNKGRISIHLQRESAEVVIVIKDDGAGLNIDAIRQQAITRGLLSETATPSDHEIMQFIFQTGFSTAKSVSQSAGRGVGMDVVANEVKKLGGTLKIDSKAGQGTQFTVRLPFTLAISQGLLIEAGGDTFAIPLPAIEGIARIPGQDLNRYFSGELTEFNYGGHAYGLHHVSALLDLPITAASEEHGVSYPVLLIHSGDQYNALVVESMQGSREMVVKSLGPQIASIHGLSGATITGDGSILLILDPTALLRDSDSGDLLETTIIEQPQVQVDTRKLVMVVDDSITVRRVTQRLLERYDMRVETAKDGVDALTKLQDVTPDVMLLDIEMPRMDGYELATNIRNDERLKDVPIIMITSRTGDKHRSRAMEIGVNEYLGKPYQEAELVEHIEQLTGSEAA